MGIPSHVYTTAVNGRPLDPTACQIGVLNSRSMQCGTMMICWTAAARHTHHLFTILTLT